MKSFGKRGQNLMIGLVIFLVLAMFILVILVFGWSGIVDKFNSLFNQDNVGIVQRTCSVFCGSKSKEFCFQKINLKSEDLPVDSSSVWGTCFAFSNNESYGKYSIEKCPSLCSRLTSTVVSIDKN